MIHKFKIDCKPKYLKSLIKRKRYLAYKKNHQICPECFVTNIITDVFRSEETCSNCGLVLNERMANSMKEYNFSTNTNVT